MGVEIERKFLVRSDAWRSEVVRSARLRQGYLCSQSGRTVRVRVAGEAAFLTIKGPADAAGVSRSEWEYAIPVVDALHMLDTLCERPQIEKVRHEVRAAGGTLKWEVDEFLGDNAPLMLAEIELPSVDSPFARPAWLGAEVSADPRYRNSHLAGHPFATWGE
ncbi:MAG: CYTH domain-containing protein [Phycisphaerales bacterium]